MGQGFEINGLSGIVVGSKNFYSHGVNEPVSLQPNGEYILDGNPLVLISGNQGCNGSVYRTENEIYSQITSFGNNINNPQYFKLETKGGVIYEYGNSGDSRMEAGNSSNTIMWCLNKVTDKNGNYIRYHYNKNNGESYISKIEYGGNQDLSIVPYCNIEFEYIERTDKNIIYVAGYAIPQTVLLKSIKVKSEKSVYREYKLDYATEFYSHLTKITEYGTDGTHLNPTELTWGTSTNQLTTNDIEIFGGDFNYYPGDFNGDGITDFIKAPKAHNSANKKCYLFIGKPDGSFIDMGEFLTVDDYYKGFYVKDIDGDGKDEIFLHKGTTENSLLSINPSDEQYICYKYDGSGFIQNSTFNINTQSRFFSRGSGAFAPYRVETPQLLICDFIGSGQNQTMILYHNNTFYASYELPLSTNPAELTSANQVIPCDFNGNGKVNLLVTKGNNAKVLEYSSTMLKFETIYNSDNVITSSHRIMAGDFNGDGKTDLLLYKSNVWSILYSTGTSFVNLNTNPITKTIDPFANTTDNNYFIADINGDGKEDIIEMYKLNTTTTQVNIYNSNGRSFVPESHSLSLQYITRDFFTFSNFGGDCKNRMLYHRNVTTEKLKTISFHNKENRHLIKRIKDGFGQVSEIKYKLLTDGGDFYERGANSTFPLMDIQYPFYTVSEAISPDGIGGSNHTTYQYKNARIHRQGKGFLGFGEVKSSNIEQGIYTVSQFDVNEYNHVALKKREKRTTSNQLISESSYTNSYIFLGGKRYFPYISKIVEYDALKNIHMYLDYVYDQNGNLTYQTKSYDNGDSETVSNEYTQISSFCPSNITKKTTTKIRSGDSPYARTITYQYDSRGRMNVQTNDPQTSKSTIITNSYNGFGYLTQQILSATGEESRKKTFGYSPDGKYLLKETNSLNISKQYEYDTYGNITCIVDENMLRTTFYYDGFGRLIKTVFPNSNTSFTSYNWNLNNNICYYTETKQEGTPTVLKYFDKLGRNITTKIVSFNKQESITVTVFNNIGQEIKTSLPYFEGETPKWITKTYDNYDRLTSVDNLGQITRYEYSGNTLKTIQPSGQSSTQFFDSSSKLTKVTDNGGEIQYEYASSGNVRKITALGVYYEMFYDMYNNQIKLKDPNAGTIEYNYNAFDEPIYQKDARGNETVLSYNSLGQLTSKASPDATINYQYANDGKPVLVSNESTSQSFAYDTHRNLIEVTEAINGNLFKTQYGYDNVGNIKSIKYPSNYELSYIRDSYGNIIEIKQATNNKSIWKLSEGYANGTVKKYLLNNQFNAVRTYDENEHLSKIEIGNIFSQSYNFDIQTGNLLERKDNIRNLTETFGYNNVNALISSAVDGQSAYTYNYDALGNMTNQTLTGDISYQLPEHIHAPSSTENINDIISTEVQNISYTSFQKILSIEEGKFKQNFVYGADQQRKQTELFENGILKKTHFYAGDYEKITSSGTTKEVIYLKVENVVIAMIEKENGIEKLYYVCTDHLGSILSIFTENAVVVEEQNFDAWGNRRNPTDLSYNNIPNLQILSRGFTGHEHMNEFGLTNMNGRLYDPILASFLSPDPYVQMPDFTQSFNRYAYCMNNPLSYVDPDGEFFITATVIIGAIIGGYSGYKIAQAKGLDFGDFKTWAYMVGGAVIGGVSGGLGSSIAASSIPFANTFSLAASSFTNSVGLSIITGVPLANVSIGAASYDLTSGTFNYLGKKGNGGMENLGYGLGALSNLNDVWNAAFSNSKGDVLNTDSFSDEAITPHTAYKNSISHGSMNRLKKAWPERHIKFGIGLPRKGNSDYGYAGSWNLTVPNLNQTPLNALASLNLPYQGLTLNCVNVASLGVWLSGIPNLPFHPWLHHGSMYLYTNIRPDLFSYHIYNKYK